MKCSRCQMNKPDSDFQNDKGETKKSCRKCQEHSKRTYAQDPERSILRATKSQKNRRDAICAYKRDQIRKHPERYLHHSARTRARRRGIPFDLSVNDIRIPENCPVLGVPLTINDGNCGPNSPSLDRIVPDLGYVRGNVVVISHKANTIKSNATLDELRLVLRFLEGHAKNS